MDYDYLNQKVKEIKTTDFAIPPEIRMNKKLLPNGNWCYYFKHKTLGELGRMHLIPDGNNLQLAAEVSGEQDDPMTTTRREILEPLVRELTEKMGDAMGRINKKSAPYSGPTREADYVGK